MANEQATCDTVLKGGVVIDPATGRNGRFDVGILAGRISAIEPTLATGGGTKVIDVAGKLVIAGMIDTHAHVYEHVTGKFGLNADMVGVRSATTTVIDQGGPSCMTIRGFRHFVAEPASSRVLAFISNYLVGGLEGHYYPDLYGPGGVNVDHTVRAIDENRDIVKGVKSHAEIGGASRWGLEVVKLGQRIAREADIPLYIHLGQLWPTADNAAIDADAYMREFVPLMGEGDVLAHPFTRHPGGFVSEETGEVHPVIWEAIERGVVVDVGHGSHFSFDMARRTLDAGIRPFTLGADMHGYNVRMPQPGMSEEERTASPFAGIAPFNLTIAMTDLLALGLRARRGRCHRHRQCREAHPHGGRTGQLGRRPRGRRHGARRAEGPFPALRQQRGRCRHRYVDPPGILPAGRDTDRRRLTPCAAGDRSGGLTGSNPAQAPS